MKNLLIIGGVAAGATAAAKARRLDESVNITIIEAGNYISFANCGLPYYIGGDIEHRSSLVLQSPESFKKLYNVNVYINTLAVKIDTVKKTVTAVKNENELFFPYDKLVLAQGSRPIMPDVPGICQDNVFKLWTLDDMDSINNYITDHDAGSALIAGAGYIGLEICEALVNRGLKVSLVETEDSVMPSLEKEISGCILKELVSKGVNPVLNNSVLGFEKNTAYLNDREIEADIFIVCAGVRPNTQLAMNAGLKTGVTGGLEVNQYLQTSDENIYAAGDIIETYNYIAERTMRIPLAGPANRQGRIAAENAMGGMKIYKGSIGTSIIKVFHINAGSTGIGTAYAEKTGFRPDTAVVHKVSHTSYYPGAEKISLMLIYDRDTHKILGAQAVGPKSIDKRLDIISTAIAGNFTVNMLSELDLAYAPPFNSPNGPVNMLAFTAMNKISGHSPSISVRMLDDFVKEKGPFVLDIRDPISYRKHHFEGSINIDITYIRQDISRIPKNKDILIISEDGQKGNTALRILAGSGHKRVFYLSGGMISAINYSYFKNFKNIALSIQSQDRLASSFPEKSGIDTGKIIIDVRTVQEYNAGAVSSAINIPLDELPGKVEGFPHKDIEIVLYCASGARSAYGKNLLEGMGFTNVKNGGGLADMLRKQVLL